MIFPAGKPRNNDLSLGSAPLMNSNADIHNPRSPNYQPEFKKHASKKRDRSWETLSGESKLKDTLYSVFSKSATVSSARAGKLTDEGGPVRQMKTSTSNSIWNPNRLAQITDAELTKGEQIKADNKALQEKRAADRKQNFHINMAEFVAAYKDGVFDKGNSVQSQRAHAKDGSGLRTASHHIGIADSLNKLEDMAALTPGEQIAANAKLRKAAKRDRSWAEPNSPQNSRQMLTRFLSNVNPAKGGK